MFPIFFFFHLNLDKNILLYIVQLLHNQTSLAIFDICFIEFKMRLLIDNNTSQMESRNFFPGKMIIMLCDKNNKK